MSTPNAAAMRWNSQPVSRVGPESPNPGRLGEHEVEGVGRVGAVGARVGQRADHRGELDDRARPAVRHEQRCGVRLGGAEVGEVDVRAVRVDVYVSGCYVRAVDLRSAMNAPARRPAAARESVAIAVIARARAP